MHTSDHNKVNDSFTTFFSGNTGKRITVLAPGRVNLVGEHTDYTGGLVLPAAINRGTWITAAPNNSKSIQIISVGFDEKIKTINLEDPLVKENDWCDYLRGILLELRKSEGSLDTGFDAVVYGTIPNGAGLSSSASLELALALIILSVNGREVPRPGSDDMTELALLGQRCENSFVGVNCGIMDQFIIANGKKGMAIKLNCSTLSWEYTPVDTGNKRIIIANTKKQRRLEESKYNERREECETGFQLLCDAGLNVDNLGALFPGDWDRYKSVLDNFPIMYKRVRHVVEENQRVRLAATALEKGDIQAFAGCINDSGDSLRNLFEVTGKHLDAIVDSARAATGVIAARMTGAGFGGCAVLLVDERMVDSALVEIASRYNKKTGFECDFYHVEVADGAGIIQ
jgi:galactokinase